MARPSTLKCKYPCFADEVKRALALCDPPISNAELARLLQVNPSSVTHMLKGHWLPRAATLAHLALILDREALGDSANLLGAILEDCPLSTPRSPLTPLARALTAPKGFVDKVVHVQ